jgi:hypothetical protein
MKIWRTPTTIDQGDLLIWIGAKPFIDSRLALYRASGEEDLIALHDETRRALRIPQIDGRNPEDGSPRKDEEIIKERTEKLSAQRAIWKKTLDRFNVTHAIPALYGASPDYRSYFDLSQQVVDEKIIWQQTHLGAVTSTFYRTDVDDPALKEYLEKGRINFIEQAFKTEANDAEIRPEWARSKTIYDRYLSLPETQTPNPIQQSKHYAQYLFMEQQRRLFLSPAIGAAISHLAIRSANAGLAVNPQSADGFRVLGHAYGYLGRLEARISASQGIRQRNRRRYYQAVEAFSQAITIEPNHFATHFALFQFYLQQGKLDLALREIETYTELTANVDRSSEAQRRNLAELERYRENLKARLQQINAAVDQQLLSGADRFRVAQFAISQGCSLLAQRILEEDREGLDRNPAAQLLRATLLMEVGEPDEAESEFAKLESIAGATGMQGWRTPAAITALGNGNYRQAQALWVGMAEQGREQRFLRLMRSLPLAGSANSWPMQHTVAAVNGLGRLPQQESEYWFNTALCQLESGRNEEAADSLRQTLNALPETTYRPLVRFYLNQTTGELIDAQPPSDWIPVSSDLFVVDESDEEQTPTTTPDGPAKDTPKAGEESSGEAPAKAEDPASSTQAADTEPAKSGETASDDAPAENDGSK